MTRRTLMIQGTGSHVGKSILVTALCRIFVQDGLSVAPFKAQNMSNNAHVCRDGGEIGRAQAVQAMAAGVEATVDMNPVLLKPCTDVGSQVIVRGKVVKTMEAAEYQRFKPSLIPTIQKSIDALRNAYDVVVIEGAGSPAEINLQATDIVNMKTAALAEAPVILVGDINLGGVFAQIIGTMQLLYEDRHRVKGFIINKFRGDMDILRPGLSFLEAETGRKVLGVLPYFKDIYIPEEDSSALQDTLPRTFQKGQIRIDVIKHPRISNFTDFDALAAETDVSLRYIERPDQLIPDVLILPGTKSTIPDLRHLRSVGFDRHIQTCVNKGTSVIGICGGFQMLGARILDPQQIESSAAGEEGLGLLPTVTTFDDKKETTQLRAIHLESGSEITGYEIHMGRTQGRHEKNAPLFKMVERSGHAESGLEGMSAKEGQIWGSYIHGLFDNPAFRKHFLEKLRVRRCLEPAKSEGSYQPSDEIDKLAALVRKHLDLSHIYQIMEKAA